MENYKFEIPGTPYLINAKRGLCLALSYEQLEQIYFI